MVRLFTAHRCTILTKMIWDLLHVRKVTYVLCLISISNKTEIKTIKINKNGK